MNSLIQYIINYTILNIIFVHKPGLNVTKKLSHAHAHQFTYIHMTLVKLWAQVTAKPIALLTRKIIFQLGVT
jgi:hypothetical protein